MPQEKICKTVRQYSKEAISDEDMKKLQEIAGDYRKVKQYVYARYGGIGGLAGIYPGYTVQKEMTAGGLRKELGLPSVYFYLAVHEALGDIRGQWERTKAKTLAAVNRNGNLTEEEKHYLRFVLKSNNAFEAVLNRKPIELPGGVGKQYGKLAGLVETQRLHGYLCRQVRKNHEKCGQGAKKEAEGFSVAERGYRYGEKEGKQGLFLSMKEQRSRIFIPLTEGNHYQCQLKIRLYPEEKRIEIHAPVYVTPRSHGEYENKVGVSLGMYIMLTTDQGHCYGEELGRYQVEYGEWIREQAVSYSRNRSDNPGRKKYQAKKRRLEEQLHSYVNQELNRFLRQEKPKTVYLAKLPKPGQGGVNRKINHSAGVWQRGYIRERLKLKCREQSVELKEVPGKDISRECSSCGGMGEHREGRFLCGACGGSMEEKRNTARNVLKRGLEEKIL